MLKVLSLSPGLNLQLCTPKAQDLDLTVTAPDHYWIGLGWDLWWVCSLWFHKPCAGCAHSLLGLWPGLEFQARTLVRDTVNTELAAARLRFLQESRQLLILP